MRLLSISILLLFLASCVPISIAPNIETYEIVKSNRFKKDLPPFYGFVFENPKEADAFFQFLQAKYDLESTHFDAAIPVQFNKQTYYLNYYEREKTTKTVNVIPIAIDAKRESNGNDPIFEDVHLTRSGQWFLILMVTDGEMKDVLKPNHSERPNIVAYLEALKNEYLSTHNYAETYLKRRE